MKKIILFLICLLILVVPTAIFASESIIECSVDIAEQYVSIVGQITNTTSSKRVTLLVGDTDNIIYIDQIASTGDGSFEFNFTLPDNTAEGTYNFRIGSNSDADTYIGTFMYEKTIQRQFINADLVIDVSAYIPTLSGNISCIDGKVVRLEIINKTTNTIIANEAITYEDGNKNISFTLPSLINGVDYTVLITCIEDDKTLFTVNADIDSSYILVLGTGTIQLGDNVKLDVRARTTNSDLVDKSTTITSDKEISLSIPNVVANVTCNITMQGYEKVKEDVTESENESIENATTIDTEKSLQLSIGDSAAWYKFYPKYSGNYSLTSSTGFDVSLYEKKLDTLKDITIENTIYLSYPNEYYVRVSPNGSQRICTLEISPLNGKRTEKAFEVMMNNHNYYSNLADDGKLYKDGAKVEAPENVNAVSWLCEFNGELYFSANGWLSKLIDDSFEPVGSLIKAKYTVADDKAIYFSNWSDSGKLYKGFISSDGIMIFEKMSDDIVSWIYVNGNYLYYKNALDKNKVYYVNKTITGTQTGQALE